jgi:uncharacterized protein
MLVPTRLVTTPPPGGLMRLSRPAAALAASALLLLAVPASAHVRVTSTSTTQGAYAVLTFRVPTEGTSPTERFEVLFPTADPIASVKVEPKLGWAYRVTTSKAPRGLRDEHGRVQTFVSRITWASAGRGIKPGEFDEFRVAAGPLPEVRRLVFGAVQTYKSGDVVRWVETEPGSDHPAPVLLLAPPRTESAPPSAAPTPSPSASPTSAPVPLVTATPDAVDDQHESDDLLSDRLDVAAAGAGGLALVVALFALVRSGRRRL